MSKEESEIIKMVYSRFMESEEDRWTEIDENLEVWGWLSQEEIISEAYVKYDKHCKGTFRCSQEHKIEKCFAPYILEAVEIILNLYDETKYLHPKNSYILTYYLSMSEMNMIYVS